MRPVFIAVFFFPLQLIAQGGLFIGGGANVVAVGQPHIVIENGKFINNGDFACDGSTVHIVGSAATAYSTIGGSSATIFNHLEINKSSNDTRLDYDIEVDGDLSLKGGNFILNSSDVILGGVISGETATTRITGTSGGAIIKTINLDMPAAENPGNLGIEITSAKNLGQTTIQRRHTQLSNNGNHGIYRHFNISAANNMDLDADLRIHYFDEELAGLTETSLEIWQFDGSNWSCQNLNSINPVANWVEAPGFSILHTLTLAEEMNIALPVELTHFDARLNEGGEVDITWTTATEINNDYFIVERSADGLHFGKIARVEGAGNSTAAINYHVSDMHPSIGINYYRLQQVDFDGAFTYSDVKAVNLSSGERFSVYPNPFNDVLQISVEGLQNGGELHIEIHDELGRQVYSNTILPEGTGGLFSIGEVAGFVPGNYFLNLRLGDESYAFHLIK